jgi:hypothetical protein
MREAGILRLSLIMVNGKAGNCEKIHSLPRGLLTWREAP